MERRAQWDEYNARQRAEAQRKDAEADAEAAREKQQKEDAEAQRRSAYVAQTAAEQSSENRCKEPEIARSVMEEWSGFDAAKDANIRAIDIEHLTTTAFDPDKGVLACHGIFKTNKGFDILGTLTIRKNVAGDPISTWHSDASQDTSIYERPAGFDREPGPSSVRERSMPAALSTEPGVTTPSFSTGLADRQRWEAWLAGLSGAEADGAKWWAANRNAQSHATCATAAEKDDAIWSAGCLNAQQMLAPIDIKRRSDPQYKKGWNSL